MTHHRKSAFTLIELLVVIVIIVILISILVPVINQTRKTAQAAATGAFLQALNGAIQQYHQQYGSYPGPLTNVQVGAAPAITGVTGGQITGTENLVLGLLGGLKVNTATTPPTIEFDWQLVGQGPRSLNARSPQRKDAFIDSKNLSWTDNQTAPGQENTPGPESGFFTDELTPTRFTGARIDSSIPEFVDTFPSPMPILYLRAQVGAGGIIIAGNGAHYNLNHIIAYTDPTGTHAATTFPPAGVSIGVGKKLDAYYVNNSKLNDPIPYHGLRTVDPSPGTRQMTEPGADGYTMPADAWPYFRNDSLSNRGPDNTWGTADDVLVPRQKDTFILIAAGRDRIYGTDDDITNFGPVIPSK